MGLKLMYITNDPEVAKIAEVSGVDRIFVDMEYIGKADRQGGMDTVQSHHTIEDIQVIRKVVQKADLFVRVNPIHDATVEYSSSAEEIEKSIQAGADILMLPYFKTVKEVQRFIELVDGRAKTSLLLETPEAVEVIDDILKIKGIDEIHIGLNDLSLGYGMKFMFEPLVDGTVEKLCLKFKLSGIPYGFGGIAALGTGTLPAENILIEHYRMGSTCVILSRSFCNTSKITNLDEIQNIFNEGVKAIREKEQEVEPIVQYFRENEQLVREKVKLISDRISYRE
ncbi:MAG: aldolase/citrate lyase family protein [Lachnospiraceae bacterium]|nr:aldolase/citrate lyase family protein [Lachnospiraceae bacterium]